MSNPPVQPWRPKHKAGGSMMSSPTSSGGGKSGSFETDTQISHRHGHKHGEHAFQKYRDPQQQQQQQPPQGASMPMPASQRNAIANAQAIAAQQAQQQPQAPQFNVEDALDAFGNIRESTWCTNATPWSAVQDSGVSHKRVHDNIHSFIKMVVDATTVGQ